MALSPRIRALHFLGRKTSGNDISDGHPGASEGRTAFFRVKLAEDRLESHGQTLAAATAQACPPASARRCLLGSGQPRPASKSISAQAVPADGEQEVSATMTRVRDPVLEPIQKEFVESTQGHVDKDVNNSQKALPFY